MYYSYLQTMGTFTMSNVFYNNTGSGTITRATTTVGRVFPFPKNSATLTHFDLFLQTPLYIFTKAHGRPKELSLSIMLAAQVLVRNSISLLSFFAWRLSFVYLLPDLLDIEYTNLVTYGTFTVSNCKNYSLYEYCKYPS